jgi:cell envelope opacity-associated protein A
MTGSVSLSAGQEVTIQVVANGTISASPIDTVATVVFNP